MRTSSVAAMEADLERLHRCAERAGWALGCIDVEDHQEWLRQSREPGLTARFFNGVRMLMVHGTLVVAFVML